MAGGPATQSPGAGGGEVLLISFPHHLLHAIAALLFERRKTGVPDQAPATFLVWSFNASDHASGSDFRGLVARALRRFPRFSVCFPSLAERVSALSPYRLLCRRAEWIRRRLGENRVSGCYFSHDASADHTAQALMQAFPEGRRICFGDPPGFLHPPYTVERPTIVDGGWLRNAFWASRLRGTGEIHRADLSLVAIDFRRDAGSASGELVERVPRGVFLEVIAALADGLESDAPPCGGLLSRARAGEARQTAAHLLVLGNFAASRMMSPARELALYQDICAACVPEGEAVYLKPHYGMSARLTADILQGLAGYGAELLPEGFRRVPVELLPGLPGRCRIISVSSSSALLAFLYGEDVVHALTSERIERYFDSSYVKYMRDSNQSIVDAVAQARAIARAN